MLHGYLLRNAVTPPKCNPDDIVTLIPASQRNYPPKMHSDFFERYLHFCEGMAANLFLENLASSAFVAYNDNISCLYMHQHRLNSEISMIFDGPSRFLSDVLRSSRNPHT
jgi:hypothetical protein